MAGHRAESADEEQHAQTGFMPPGRLSEEQLELAERLVKQLPKDTKQSD